MSRFVDCYDYQMCPPPSIKYDRRTLVSLDQALKPLHTEIGNLHDHAQEAKENCSYPSKHGLTKNESAAIYLYREAQLRTPLHRYLNTALRSRVESKVEPWMDFLHLFYSGLGKLPKTRGKVWRLIHINIARKMKDAEVVYWWNILSCSSTMTSLEKYRSAELILCCIDVCNGIDIGEEILILPGTGLYVKHGYDDRSIDLPVIELEELPNDPSVQISSIHSSDSKKRYVASCYLPVNSKMMDNEQSSRRRPFLVIHLSTGERYELIDKRRINRNYAVLYTRDGNQYVNFHADQQVNGTGKCYWSNGDEYEGSFQDGKKNGFGTLITTDKYMYRGSWSNDVIHGEGLSVWCNGDKYQGGHSSGRITGYGYFSSAAGDHYTGYLVDGKANGKGKRRWSNGDYYEGDFRNDKKHGYGSYIFATRGSYIGYWFEDKMNGEGVLRWPSGTEYSGGFSNGKRDGVGTLHFKNGDEQKGWWQNDTYFGPIQLDSR